MSAPDPRIHVPKLHATFFSLSMISLSLVATHIPSEEKVEQAVDFEQVARIFVRRCLSCHGQGKASGQFVITSRDDFFKGGENGPAIVPGDSSASRLFHRVIDGEMPPPKKGASQQLLDEEIAILQKWIDSGAKWPESRDLDLYEYGTDERAGRDFWSLQPIVRPEVPRNHHELANEINPIDAFILDRLDRQGWKPAPPATSRELIRRVHFDLIGLPPTHEEIEAFENDTDPAAYEKLVDRLLSSPHHGERWGRYWLDLVRYAETCGYERDQTRPQAWRYRDWVVQALNDDMPYDRFVTEQLAGDEIPGHNEQSVIATGMICLGTWNDEPNDPSEYQFERLEDMVHVTSTAFLGLTVKCARCHDHKFDPIPQLDYHRMATAFWAGYVEFGVGQELGGPDRMQLGYDVMGWTDRDSQVPVLHFMKNGDPKQSGPVVEFGHLTLMPTHDVPVTPPPAGAKTTHRRLQLARWIVHPDNTLASRVMVNRLWQHHFGQGLVRSVNNFGFTGSPPTHPELLDWLASEFMQPTVEVAMNGEPMTQPWSIKRMHKLMLLSSTYRQSSNHPREDVYAARDADNQLLWKFRRRRLDAEAIRDALLSVSGQINLQIGGPSFFPRIQPEALEGLSRKSAAWQESPREEQHRRGIYIFTKRGLLPPFMTTFDFCDTMLPCGERDVTTVAPQALSLLNNEFVHEQSQALAESVLTQAGTDLERQAGFAWRRALGREPSPTEAAAAIAHLNRQRQTFSERQQRDRQSFADAGDQLPVTEGLVLDLRADRDVERDESGRVLAWHDHSGHAHHARQDDSPSRPSYSERAFADKPAIHFDGEHRFLNVSGQVLTSKTHTIIAVASDRGADGHREIFSNWNGEAGNSTSSIFLGMTGKANLRFSDDFLPTEELADNDRAFILTAVADHYDAVIHRDFKTLSKKGHALSPRNFSTAYVIGRQGTLDGEYWNGDIAELLVYDRPLDEHELHQVWHYLDQRYDLNLTPIPKDPALLALESLCHVLLNTNEFVYVD